jgi:molybdopterin-guanine dinucleotide biosynthesis protein B
MRRITSTLNQLENSPLEINSKNTPPVVCIVGFSGAGKTTVTVSLVAALKQRGLRVGTIKHDVHGFDFDQPGKDSWQHKQAGASTTLISSPAQIGMLMDVDHDHQPLELVPLLGEMDIVLVEGFKRADLPKIEVFRPENEKPPTCRNDRNLLAVVSDAHLDWGVPRYAANDCEAFAEFIVEHFKLEPLTCPGFEQSACG